MLTVVAQLRVKAGTEIAAREILASLLKPSRADTGCISYDLHTNVEDPTLFLFYELWESKDDLDTHLQTDHVRAGLGRLELAEKAQISMWELQNDPE